MMVCKKSRQRCRDRLRWQKHQDETTKWFAKGDSGFEYGHFWLSSREISGVYPS